MDVVVPFSMDTETVLAGIDSKYGTLFGAAEVTRERFGRDAACGGSPGH